MRSNCLSQASRAQWRDLGLSRMIHSNSRHHSVASASSLKSDREAPPGLRPEPWIGTPSQQQALKALRQRMEVQMKTAALEVDEETLKCVGDDG